MNLAVGAHIVGLGNGPGKITTIEHGSALFDSFRQDQAGIPILLFPLPPGRK
jgi:hypothetical protein